jgi:MoaA/NifB/PqqE/SkfB family radical SAM enzyme
MIVKSLFKKIKGEDKKPEPKIEKPIKVRKSDKHSLNGLSTINIELSSFCGHKCWCCGRRKIENVHPEIAAEYGDMDLDLLKKIAPQIPKGVVCQFHWNGDPLKYPDLGKALTLFDGHIRCFNTKGGPLLLKKMGEIIDNLENLTISMIPKDYEWRRQSDCLKEFLEKKGDRNPRVMIRCTGDPGEKRMRLYDRLSKVYGCLIVKRVLHDPMGSFDYEKEVTKPEHGMCMDFLTHPAINIKGEVSCCVRFDPDRLGVLGDLNEQSLEEIWNSPKRKEWLNYHIEGRRDKMGLCSYCDFWGIPRGW